MRRRTILKRIHKEAKLSLGTLLSKAQHLEHTLLQIRVMNSQRTTTNFYSIANKVIGFGAYLLRMRIQQRQILHIRQGKRMMGSHQTILLLAPFKEWEIDNPQTLEHILITESEPIAHFQT